jgi:hypothetical protein
MSEVDHPTPKPEIMPKTQAEWYDNPVEIETARLMIERYRADPRFELGNVLHIYADQLTKRFTAFFSVDAMLAAQSNNYRPSLTKKSQPVQLLADLYDLIAESRGLPLRAYRG